jgi:hypothetical protein
MHGDTFRAPLSNRDSHILSVAAGYAYAETKTMATMMTRLGFDDRATVCVSETVDAMYIDTITYLTHSRCGRDPELSRNSARESRDLARRCRCRLGFDGADRDIALALSTFDLTPMT